MLFKKKTPELSVDYEVLADGSVQGNLVFDWTTNTFVMSGGSPIVVKGSSSVREWINLVARVRQGRYGIYPADFGADALDIIGKKFPKGYKVSEFKRRMEESIRYCDGITSVSGFDFDGEKINFTVALADGTEEVAQVEY